MLPAESSQDTSSKCSHTLTLLQAVFRMLKHAHGWLSNALLDAQIGSVFGVVRNAYAFDREAGGSSGGTGASVAANLAMIGFGMDTGGSIRDPAAFNYLVGLRPSLGLTSRYFRARDHGALTQAVLPFANSPIRAHLRLRC